MFKKVIEKEIDLPSAGDGKVYQSCHVKREENKYLSLAPVR
jgi:hypothetical protein